jgi:gliding motility-associated lipoprotein GldH
LSCIFLLASCGETPLYTKSYSFKNNEWDADVKPSFVVEILDTTKFYTLSLTLRNTTDYSYNNFWFFFHAKSPNGETGSEPIQVQIANPDGSWTGEKSGTIVENILRFKHRKFPQKGKYTFTLEQRVTDKIAKELTDVSLTLTKDE